MVRYVAAGISFERQCPLQLGTPIIAFAHAEPYVGSHPWVDARLQMKKARDGHDEVESRQIPLLNPARAAVEHHVASHNDSRIGRRCDTSKKVKC